MGYVTPPHHSAGWFPGDPRSGPRVVQGFKGKRGPSVKEFEGLDVQTL